TSGNATRRQTLLRSISTPFMGKKHRANLMPLCITICNSRLTEPWITRNIAKPDLRSGEMSAPIQTVLIYGYGVMGRGVAKTFADAGFTTLVKSSRAGKLEGLPAKTSAVEQLPKEAPDLVIEFVPEEGPVKQAVYAALEAAYPGNAPLIATGPAG